MSTRGLRRPIIGYVRESRRRKIVLDVDLNDTPLGENSALEGTSTHVGLQEVQAIQQGGALPPATIDVEAIDDEVVISSPRSFAEASNKSRRNNEVMVVLDDDLEVHQHHSEEPTTRLALNSYNRRRRALPNRTITNCDLTITLEVSNKTKGKNVMNPPEPPQSVPPPKEPTFSCPVCMGPLAEEMSTKCGHIFCKNCIKAAIVAQSKCPTCRRKLTMKDTIRVYLPSTS
ncbi:hypothetical protein HHK36_022312 [Tetracentron sinense]|uniref:RING-type domain-containing protein n=1 Tax=Tetracentron sinense TaxID=13715 RepID=A0A834YUD2_TETSI|nr:hypothetical protein HHK36_022312 [Tetracentron sinense]